MGAGMAVMLRGMIVAMALAGRVIVFELVRRREHRPKNMLMAMASRRASYSPTVHSNSKRFLTLVGLRTVVLVLRAHRIQVTLRENQVVLICIYNVNDPAHMVKTFGHTHTICALRTKTTVTKR